METLTVHEPLLVNTLGHAAGALIFGIFVYLLLRDRAGASLRGSRLSIAAACLAFLWNFLSLTVLAMESPTGVSASLLVTMSSSVLSLLPAVLLHLSLEGRFRGIVVSAYLLSALTILIHASEMVLDEPHYHRLALVITTVGFGALTIASAVGVFSVADDLDRRRLTSRILVTMSLFLFAMSFVHLGEGEAHRSWPLELLLHHAGIPLALFVLLQDYRFVLLDAFLRFLANFLLAAGFTFVAARAAAEFGLLTIVSSRPFEGGLLLVGACLVLILFALLRSGIQRLLTMLLFRRPALETMSASLRAAGAGAADEREYLEQALRRIAELMEADPVTEAGEEIAAELHALDLVFPVLVDDLPELRDRLERRGIEVIVPLRLAHDEVRILCLGRRRGGRRYLSEDLNALARLSSQVVEQVEQFRGSELRRLVSQAELRALQSQIHPHFLFNALNTLYGIIPREASGARRTVLNLADIFRYFLQVDRTYIPLAEELHIVKAYLEIESLRLGPKLRTEIDVDPRALHAPIPVLSIQPLVENAVKHGVSAKADGGMVRLTVATDPAGLRILVEDTGRGFQPEAGDGKGHGVGLDNVKRRLQLCYGPEANLSVESGPDGTRIWFLAPVAKAAEAAG
ncbi:MAG: histidine kinase [Bryobacteraceae bacterium]